MALDSAKTPNFSTYDSRLKTFDEWSPINQDSSDLSEAGFFYTGTEDQVECFYCGSVIGKWKPDEVPILEHAKRFPHCDFINTHVSPDFLAGAFLGVNNQSCTSESSASNEDDSTNIVPDSSTPIREPEEYFEIPDEEILIRNFEDLNIRAVGVRRNDDSVQEISNTGSETYKCKVCLTEEVAIAFIPCGHLSCNPCAGQLERCHVCRKDVNDKLRIYF